MIIDLILNRLIVSIFLGTIILVPILFVLGVFKSQIKIQGISIIIETVNTLFLLGSLTFIFLIIFDFIKSFYSVEANEQYLLSIRFYSSIWLNVLLLIIIPKLILPQCIWIPKIRKSILSSILILLIWLIFWLLLNFMGEPEGWYFEINPPWYYYLMYALIYIILVGFVYTKIKSKYKSIDE